MRHFKYYRYPTSPFAEAAGAAFRQALGRSLVTPLGLTYKVTYRSFIFPKPQPISAEAPKPPPRLVHITLAADNSGLSYHVEWPADYERALTTAWDWFEQRGPAPKFPAHIAAIFAGVPMVAELLEA